MKPILSAAVAAALQQQQAVVALESTVIAHGLPAPDNLETARACEAAVRASGALPATIAIVEGDCVVGLDEAGLRAVADRRDVAKVNLSNFASIVAAGRWGATTVAATLHIAAATGIRVFATGGIGGVHRGASESFDLSADLTALARYPIITVCAGAKAILDLPKTLEALETLGVPVVGYGTDELPAFYSRSSGLPLDLRADSPAEVARLARTHWSLGFTTGLLVVAPVPAEAEVPAGAIAGVIEAALDEAAGRKLSGKTVTPFLLSQIAERTHGASLAANLALLRNNARIAGEIACSLGPHASCVPAIPALENLAPGVWLADAT
jgi:pseudouridine-5'-phosphate glycosidase